MRIVQCSDGLEPVAHRRGIRETELRTHARTHGDGHAPRILDHSKTVLVREITGLEPGSALDLGCGEGADAIWLAQRGRRVTATDISGVALDRAAAFLVDAFSKGEHP